jgi:hypothetical protein
MKTRPAHPHEIRCPACDAVVGNTCAPGEFPPFCRVRITRAEAEAVPLSLDADERQLWLRPPHHSARALLTKVAEAREAVEQLLACFGIGVTTALAPEQLVAAVKSACDLVGVDMVSPEVRKKLEGGTAP